MLRERIPASKFFNQIIQEIHSIQTSKKAEEALSSIALTGARGAADCEGRTCWLGKPRNGICQLFYTNNITEFFNFYPKKRVNLIVSSPCIQILTLQRKWILPNILTLTVLLQKVFHYLCKGDILRFASSFTEFVQHTAWPSKSFFCF